VESISVRRTLEKYYIILFLKELYGNYLILVFSKYFKEVFLHNTANRSMLQELTVLQ
jgi:hypothetical protein